MCTGRDFNRSMLVSNAHQAETHNYRVRWQQHIRSFREKCSLIVHMWVLVLRSNDGHVTAPLVGDDPIVHQSAHNTENVRVKEELRGEAKRIERHGQKVAMRPMVRFGGFEIGH